MKPILQRFLEKVDIDVSTPESCWLWKGGKIRSGYGSMRVDGVSWLAHRVSYRLLIGDIPDGLHCLHRCDVPNCVRPSHLFLGTQSDNMVDMVAKGRGRQPLPPIGEQHRHAKLNRVDVYCVRQIVSQGIASQRRVARLFGVSPSAVEQIINNKRWRHLPSDFWGFSVEDRVQIWTQWPNWVKQVERPELHGLAKVNDVDVYCIRQIVAQGFATQKVVASLLGVSHSTVSQIINKKRWDHVSDDFWEFPMEDRVRIWIRWPELITRLEESQ